MQIKQTEDIMESMKKENCFIGQPPQLINSTITVRGKGNILICKPSIRLVNSSITFDGDNSIVYLCENVHEYRLNVSLNHNNVLYVGRNNYMNPYHNLHIILSEQKHCLIGDGCLFSFGVWIRNADPHLVYSCETDKRLNPSKSVFVGDHVWIGQSATLLKGTQIDSGSIIGAMSLVAGKKVPNNESWGGNPCRKLTDSIFWDGSCVHKWRDADTEHGLVFCNIAEKRGVVNDEYKFTYCFDECTEFGEIDKILSSQKKTEIVSYLDAIYLNRKKNRFVHVIEQKKKWRLFPKWKMTGGK